MAINKNIIEQIHSNTKDDQQLGDDLINLLSNIEDGKQPKRIITPILERVKTNIEKGV